MELLYLVHNRQYTLLSIIILVVAYLLVPIPIGCKCVTSGNSDCIVVIVCEVVTGVLMD